MSSPRKSKDMARPLGVVSGGIEARKYGGVV
jgi:hypothetical protein